MLSKLALALIRIGRTIGRNTFLQVPALNPIYRLLTRLAAGAGDIHGLAEVRWHGYQMLIPAKDITILPSVLAGDYESVECDLLTRLTEPGMTAADIGANVGLISVILANAVGKAGLVHAFEPTPKHIKLLEQNLSANGFANVAIHPFALGSASATGNLYRSERDTGTHSLRTAPRDPASSILVQVRRLDDVLPTGYIDVMKLDVEGWEEEVLRGAVRLIEKQPPLLLCEFDGRSANSSGLVALLKANWSDFYAVDSRSRRVESVDPSGWETVRYTNVLAVPRRHAANVAQTLRALGLL